MGWTLLALGLVSCLFARTFKLGVVVMVLGNIPLILGIAAPRRVLEWVLNQGIAPSAFPTVEQSHSLGIASGLVFYLLLFLLYWYPLKGRKGPAYYFWQRKVKRLSDDDPIMGEDGLLASERPNSKNAKRGKTKARASTLHLKSGDNPLSLKATSQAHDELTQLDADREPTLSSELFTKRGPRRAAARALAQASQASAKATPTATPAAAPARPAAAPATVPAASSAPSLGNFLSRLDAMTSSASPAGESGANPLQVDLKPRSAIPDAVVPGGMDLRHEPHVSAGVTSEPSLSGQKVSDLLHNLSHDASGQHSAEVELKARMQTENESKPSAGKFSFADILSSASSRQSKLEARAHEGFAPDLDAPSAPEPFAPDAPSRSGPTVRPSARATTPPPTPVDEALKEQGALADDEIELSHESKDDAWDKTKLYSPGRTVGQALAELEHAIPTEAEVISSELPPAESDADDDLITALSAAEVEIVKADQISERAQMEAAAAQAQDVASERVQHIKSLEAELEAKEAALKAREAALEAQQAALKAKEAMLAMGNKDDAEPSSSASIPNPAAETSVPQPTVSAPQPTEDGAESAPQTVPGASYSFVIKSPQKSKKPEQPSPLPNFMGDSTSYSFELNLKSPVAADKDEAPSKRLKVTATFSEHAPDQTPDQTSAAPEAAETAVPETPNSPEPWASMAALKAQAQAENRALSERREQKEAQRQRDEIIWQRAERVAQELLSEVKSPPSALPTTAAQLAARQGQTPAPAKNLGSTASNLPYALTADYTDAGQDEARSLAALLKGDSDLAQTVEKVKAQTDAALIAQGIATPEGIKSLGGKAPSYSHQEDSAEVERMFDQITRVLQESSDNKLKTTPAAEVAPLTKLEAPAPLNHPGAAATPVAASEPVGSLEVKTPATELFKTEPAARAAAPASAAQATAAAKAPPTQAKAPAARANQAPAAASTVTQAAPRAPQPHKVNAEGISDNTVVTRTPPAKTPKASASRPAAAKTAAAPAPKAAPAQTNESRAAAPKAAPAQTNESRAAAPKAAVQAAPAKAAAKAAPVAAKNEAKAAPQTQPAPASLKAPAAHTPAAKALPQRAVPAASAPAASAASSNAPQTTPTPVAPAAKPRHSLKAKRRSAAPEASEAPAAPAPTLEQPTADKMALAAVPRRASLKSHSLKRTPGKARTAGQ